MPRTLLADTLNWADVEARLQAALDSATESQRLDGLQWYGAANSLAADLSEATFPPVSAECCAGVIAALSPQANWESNVEQATALCNGETVQNTDSRLGKAYECLGGSDPATVLRGPKESAFYQSIIDPTGCRSACIDRHMVRAALGVETDEEIKRWIKRAKVYDRIADAIARIADREGLPVPACQAIIWNVIRDPRQGINRDA